MEFGNESLWLRLPPKNGKPGNTVKRLSFVLSFDDTDSSQGLEMVKDALEFLAFTMKKRETGPVGGLLLNYVRKKQNKTKQRTDVLPVLRSASEVKFCHILYVLNVFPR